MRTASLFLALALFLSSFPAASSQISIEAERKLTLLRKALDDGRTDDAIALGEEITAMTPARSSYFHWLGRALGAKALEVKNFTELYWLARTESALKKAIEIDPENLEARLDIIQFDFSRRDRSSKEVPDRALKEAEEIARRNPVLGHLAWSRIYLLSKDFAKAEGELRKAVALAPRELRPLGALVEFLASQLRFQEAIEACQKALETNPSNPVPLYLMGKLTLMSGRNLTAGLAYLETYLEKELPPEAPSHADAYWRQGMILEQLGKKDAALKAYKKAVELDPGHQEAAARLPKATPPPAKTTPAPAATLPSPTPALIPAPGNPR